jgi:hypothetical protein
MNCVACGKDLSSVLLTHMNISGEEFCSLSCVAKSQDTWTGKAKYAPTITGKAAIAEEMVKDGVITVEEGLQILKSPVVTGDKVAIKFDNSKPDYSLLPLDLLDGTVKVFEFGSKKYARDNFRAGFDPHRPLAACLRHLVEVQAALRLGNTEEGQARMADSESGLAHLHHAICSLLILVDSLRVKGFKV